MPQVSIVVPVYNVEKYLKRCLNSILNQTYTDWECIVIDDGSTDFSWMICDKYARKDERFKVIHQKNQGVSKARNIGIEVAKGDFITFIDPDDYINDKYIKELINEQKKIDADIVVAKADINIDKNMFPKRSNDFRFRVEAFIRQSGLLPSKDSLSKNSKAVLVDRISRSSFSPWGKLFKIKLWNKIRFPVGVPKGEDLFTICEVLSIAELVHYSDEAIYYYTVRNNGLSHATMTRDQYHITNQSWLESCNRMIEMYPNEEFSVRSLYAALKFLVLRPCLKKEKKHEN